MCKHTGESGQLIPHSLLAYLPVKVTTYVVSHIDDNNKCNAWVKTTLSMSILS